MDPNPMATPAREAQEIADIFKKAYTFTRAREAQASGYYPYFIPIADSSANEVIIDGRIAGHGRLQQLPRVHARSAGHGSGGGGGAEVRHRLHREPVLERHARHPREAGARPRRVLREGSLPRLLDRFPDQPRHDLQPGGPRRRRGDGQVRPRQHRGRLPARLRRDPPLPAQRDRRPRSRARADRPQARAVGGGGRRLLDGGRHRAAARDRRRVPRPRRAAHGGRGALGGGSGGEGDRRQRGARGSWTTST